MDQMNCIFPLPQMVNFSRASLQVREGLGNNLQVIISKKNKIYYLI